MVFHQVDETNQPMLDLSHVLTCLNKVCPCQYLRAAFDLAS
jgi:hypothetical protein